LSRGGKPVDKNMVIKDTPQAMETNLSSARNAIAKRSKSDSFIIIGITKEEVPWPGRPRLMYSLKTCILGVDFRILGPLYNQHQR